MTSRLKVWNNVHRAMTPLAHWYALIDNDVILDIQNKVIHEVLHDRSCLIKWAPMHKQVTMLQKLLSHIFEQYADIQDDSYISDKHIEEYLETFMPRPHIMPMSVQGPVRPQPEVAHVLPRNNTEQRLEQGLCQIRRVLFPSEIEPEDEPMPLDGISLDDESVYIPNDSQVQNCPSIEMSATEFPKFCILWGHTEFHFRKKSL